MKRIISVLLFIAALLSLSSCDALNKTFSENGLSITLDISFSKQEQRGYDICYANSKSAVLALEEEFSLQEGFGDLTLDEYGEQVRKVNSSKSPSELMHSDGLTYITYEFFNNTIDEPTTFCYMVTMFKGSDSFWLVMFACEKQYYDSQQPLFFKWAKTIIVD